MTSEGTVEQERTVSELTAREEALVDLFCAVSEAWADMPESVRAAWHKANAANMRAFRWSVAVTDAEADAANVPDLTETLAQSREI